MSFLNLARKPQTSQSGNRFNKLATSQVQEDNSEYVANVKARTPSRCSGSNFVKKAVFSKCSNNEHSGSQLSENNTENIYQDRTELREVD